MRAPGAIRASSECRLVLPTLVILPDAVHIARENGVKIFLETDLIVTDLFPDDVARGKHVLLIYRIQ